MSEERRVYVSFDTPPDEYHLGERAEAIITVAVIETAYALPGSEIRELEGSTGLIWTVENGRALGTGDLIRIRRSYKQKRTRLFPVYKGFKTLQSFDLSQCVYGRNLLTMHQSSGRENGS